MYDDNMCVSVTYEHLLHSFREHNSFIVFVRPPAFKSQNIMTTYSHQYYVILHMHTSFVLSYNVHYFVSFKPINSIVYVSLITYRLFEILTSFKDCYLTKYYGILGLPDWSCEKSVHLYLHRPPPYDRIIYNQT